ncbi:MAG: PAS domain S-box protein [Candidatus Margulisiibacteriota bacterium]
MFNIISVVLGTVLLGLSLNYFWLTWRNYGQKSLFGWWIALSVLLGGFIFGYLVYLVNLITSKNHYLEGTVVAQVFFWGALFTFCCANLLAATLKARQELAELELREAARLKAIFQMIPDLLFITDSQGKIVDYQAGRESDLFVPPNVFMNRPVSDILPVPTGQRAQQAISEALRNNRLITIEYSLPLKAGEQYFQASISPAGHEQALVIVRNITERKTAESKLAKSEETFRTLAESSPSMIFINQQGRVVFTNKKAVEMLGYSLEEFYRPDFNYLHLIAPEYLERVKQNMQSHLAGAEIAPYEYALIAKDGRRIATTIATKLIKYGDGPAILGVVTDISALKSAERSLRDSAADLKQISDLAVGRELKMVELEKEVDALRAQLGKEPKYK